MAGISKDEARQRIATAANEANFGPAPYLKDFENGATMVQVLKEIESNKKQADEFQEQINAKRELDKRIEEFTVIANKNGLAPEKYISLLQNGKLPSDVISILHADAKKQGNLSENALDLYKDTPAPQNATESKLGANKNITIWQGDFELTFPDGETAKLFGGKCGLYEQHGVKVEKKGEWRKLK